jgi:hypothetical protein
MTQVFTFIVRWVMGGCPVVGRGECGVNEWKGGKCGIKIVPSRPPCHLLTPRVAVRVSGGREFSSHKLFFPSVAVREAPGAAAATAEQEQANRVENKVRFF